MKTRRLTVLALFAALAMVLSYVEMLLPPIWSAIPGIKVGLGNMVTIALLYKFSVKEAAIVSLIRIVAVSFLFGNLLTLAYSIAGAFFSIVIMALLKKTNLFSTVGVSIAGGVFHNLGQIIMAIILLKTMEIGYYMIVLTFTGTLAGVVIGIASALVLKYIQKLKIN